MVLSSHQRLPLTSPTPLLPQPALDSTEDMPPRHLSHMPGFLKVIYAHVGICCFVQSLQTRTRSSKDGRYLLITTVVKALHASS